MPYLSLNFADDVNASMRNTAIKLAEGSPFAPETADLHVPCFGSLHGYPHEVIRDAAVNVLALQGRFIRWEIAQHQLRVTIALASDGLSELYRHLRRALPRGRPWRSHYVTLGSVAHIEPERRDEFLQAVVAAFPIDETIYFTTATSLGYHANGSEPMDATMSKLNAKAPAFLPAATTSTIKKKSKRRKKNANLQRPSPHMKWKRKEALPTGMSIDQLIRRSADKGRRAAPAAKQTHA